MSSLFEIGKSGVQAYRQALSVTGQNIANVNTDGYNRRAADLEEVPSVQGGVIMSINLVWSWNKPNKTIFWCFSFIKS